MNKYLKISLILCTIAAICGLLIASVNLITAPIIEKNREQTINEACSEIYALDRTEKSEEENTRDSIINVYIAYDSSNQIMGHIYEVSGKNAYGTITALVGINEDGSLEKVVLVTNTQSFGQTVADHVETNYNELQKPLSDIDVKCGATYGAKLVKSLVNDAINDYQEKGQ